MANYVQEHATFLVIAGPKPIAEDRIKAVLWKPSPQSPPRRPTGPAWLSDQQATDVVAKKLASKPGTDSAALFPILTRAAAVVGGQGHDADVIAVLRLLPSAAANGADLALIEGLGQGMRGKTQSLVAWLMKIFMLYRPLTYPLIRQCRSSR